MRYDLRRLRLKYVSYFQHTRCTSSARHVHTYSLEMYTTQQTGQAVFEAWVVFEAWADLSPFPPPGN